MRWLAQQAIAAFGYITLDSFEGGNTLTLPNQVLRLEATGEYYRWDGGFPKTVPAGSTPESTGGIGSGKWLSVGDAALRTSLASPAGFGFIGGTTYAQIRAYNGAKNRVYCLGKEKINDGGYGFFEVDASDTTSADNGGTILVDAAGRRWKRQYDGSVNLLWFAKGDGTTDDSAALQNAVDATKFGGRLDVPMPSVNYKIATECVISRPINIVGNGGSCVTTTPFPGFKAAGHNSIFKLKATLNNYMFGAYGITGVHMRDIFLEGPALRNNGLNGICTDETVNSGVYHVRNNTFTNVNMRYFDNGWNIRGVCYLTPNLSV